MTIQCDAKLVFGTYLNETEGKGRPLALQDMMASLSTLAVRLSRRGIFGGTSTCSFTVLSAFAAGLSATHLYSPSSSSATGFIVSIPVTLFTPNLNTMWAVEDQWSSGPEIQIPCQQTFCIVTKRKLWRQYARVAIEERKMTIREFDLHDKCCLLIFLFCVKEI